MAFADREQFRVLFLDKRNQLIADEVQQVGTVDHTPVYPREVVKRALELSATASSWSTTIPLVIFSHVRSRLIPFNHAILLIFSLGAVNASNRGCGRKTAPSCRSQTAPSRAAWESRWPVLTDSAIRHAIKRVEKSRKQKTLADGEGRGTGRLVLILKPMPTRVTAEWMAQQWRDGRRTKAKIGSYPAMSLREAREIFQRDFADVILKGRSIKIAGDTRPGTVADLFDGYVGHLKKRRQAVLVGGREGA